MYYATVMVNCVCSCEYPLKKHMFLFTKVKETKIFLIKDTYKRNKIRSANCKSIFDNFRIRSAYSQTTSPSSSDNKKNKDASSLHVHWSGCQDKYIMEGSTSASL